MWRVFIDTSALLVGLNSPHGASGTILTLGRAGKLTIVISPDVVAEAERNLPTKFPLLGQAWTTFLLMPPVITKSPTLAAVRRAHQLVPTSDAPILAAALTAKSHILVTLDREFIELAHRAELSLPVMLPSEFIDHLRRTTVML